MGIRVVMELEGDNDELHADRLDSVCQHLEQLPRGGGRVKSCIITTGEVTITERLDGRSRRPQVKVR